MGVKITWQDFGLDDMLKNSQKLDGKIIEVGYPEPSKEGGVAMIQEYGARIPVTPKMRAFFRSRGIHLSPQKTVIVIPERSFLRAGFDKHQKEVLNQAAKAAGHFLGGYLGLNQYLDMIGLLFSSKIKDYAIQLKNPPNAALTVLWKGSSNPLVDSGQMVRAITWKVKQ